MVVLEAIGFAASEIFDYNRENFKFDQELRFKKEETRLGMQIERFNLFREDIEDLVNLTVQKMDMYHGVAEIFLAFSLTLFTEGRISGEAPAFYTSAYFFSVACAWIYILVATWLAVYASITAHSFGVRLRTRYVRLPIPTMRHISRLTAKLSEFERQNVADMGRLPFSTASAQQWQYEQDRQSAASSSTSWNARRTSGAEGELLGVGEAGFGKMDVMRWSANDLGKHVRLYRQLQSKWQCFDAYSRVSMAMGVNNLLQAMNFFVIGITLFNNRSPTSSYTLTAIFQSCRLALGYLDVAGLRKRVVSVVQLTGTLPVIIVLAACTTPEGPRSRWAQIASAAAFYLMAIWFEMLIWVAGPTDACLPRKYRAVLFLDVFGDHAYDGTECEHRPPSGDEDVQSRAAQARLAALASDKLCTAHSALRRWEAVQQEAPDLVSGAQGHALGRLRKALAMWRRAYQGQLVQQRAADELRGNSTLQDARELRAWSDLSKEEQEEDSFANAWVGPLGSGRYFSLELDHQAAKLQQGERVLTLEEVEEYVGEATAAVQELLAGEDTTAASPPRKVEGRGSQSRLPWHVLHFVSRVLQIVWVFLAGAHTFQAWTHGGQQHDPFLHTLERRLDTATELTVKPVAVRWPHGEFFRVEGLARLGERLLVSSTYATYRVASTELEPLELEPQGPGRALPLCARAGPCLQGELLDGRVAFWSEGSSRVALPVKGRSWQMMAGAVLPCSQVLALAPSRDVDAQQCLLLAGWDGSRLPLAAVPLLAGLPSAAQSIAARFDVPVGDTQAEAQVVALQVEPEGTRLWVLLQGGRLQAWDLLGLRMLGEWRLLGLGFTAVAMSVSSELTVWVAGAAETGRPVLARAHVPGMPSRAGPVSPA